LEEFGQEAIADPAAQRPQGNDVNPAASAERRKTEYAAIEEPSEFVASSAVIERNLRNWISRHYAGAEAARMQAMIARDSMTSQPSQTKTAAASSSIPFKAHVSIVF
jgi:hypothetical protein